MTSLVDRFWSAFERDPDRRRVPRSPDIPGDMLDEERLLPPWVRWKVVPGRTSRQAFKEWQDNLGLHLPDAFRDWFLSRHTLQVDCGFLRLAASPSNKPFGDLEELLEWDIPLFRTKQLFPIGDEALGDAGPLCLDLREKGEPAIVYWDAGPETVSPAIFSSFGKLLELSAAAMESDADVFEDEALLGNWLALDTSGAGGPGLSYWRREDPT